MAPTLEELGIDRLSLDDRLNLAEAIWESVAREMADAPLTPAQRTELERRLADIAENPNKFTPWEEVESRLLAKIRS